VTFGSQFAIFKSGSSYKIKDLSTLPAINETSLRYPEGKKETIQVGNVINFALAVIYEVKQLEGDLKLHFLKEISPSDKDYDKDDEEQEMGEGTSIGRLKKNDITIQHSKISGEHCTILPDGTLLDSSTIGTYLHCRNAYEFENGSQSLFVTMSKSMLINVSSY